jgi:ribosomal protein L22
MSAEEENMAEGREENVAGGAQTPAEASSKKPATAAKKRGASKKPAAAGEASPASEEPTAEGQPQAEPPAAKTKRAAKKPAAKTAAGKKAAPKEPEAEAETAGADEDEGKDEDAETPAAEKPAPSAPKAARRAPGQPPRRRVVRAHARHVRTSARKARMVCGHLRGKTVPEARAILAFTSREVARDWSKLLESAVANAENNHELLEEDLVVREAYADEGPTIKRFRPRALGRATPIHKRTSHLTITLTPGP